MADGSRVNVYLELVIEKVRRRLVAHGGREGFAALEALDRLSASELAVLVHREAQQ